MIKQIPYFCKLLAFLFLITITGCTEKELLTTQDSPTTLNSIAISRAELTTGKTHREYRTAYAELSPSQKHELWLDKLQHSKSFFNDPAQLAFIGLAMNMLSTELFETGIPDEEADEFVKSALKLFNMDQVAQLFFVLHDFDQFPGLLGPIHGGSGIQDCECRYSLYCGVFNTCEKKVCGENWNCGVFGGSRCTGICDNSYMN